jgi:hypothetical protein
MTPRIRIERRDAHEAMYAGFGLCPAMRIMAFDQQSRRFYAGLVARRFFDDLDFEFVPLAPARIHAKQHARPIATLGAASAGMNFDIGVVGIDFARQERLDLALLGFSLQSFELPYAFLLGLGIGLGLGKLDERHGIFEFRVEALERSQPVFEFGTFTHDFLRGIGIVPEVGIFDFGIQFGETACRGLDVKDASSAIPWIA